MVRERVCKPGVRINSGAHIHIHAKIEHSYRAARVYIGSLVRGDDAAREISSLRNLDEIARITWEPGRTHIYARAHERIR